MTEMMGGEIKEYTRYYLPCLKVVLY
jgi:hypothetical protein